ncbi:MAG: hypothetical protein B7Y83_05430 [Flavobacteriales bacterium 32-34-25]|nr:MAG: hypothetical protein B7Y83_05430 [Flavobacteriales bacterium 32-34-25]
MSEQVVTIDGEILDINSFTEESWNDLKKNYTVGNLKMICCDSNAIPKTSINFKKFFAHQNDECKTAPETIWHKTTKRMIIDELLKQGYIAIEEQKGDKWIADVYLELNGRKIAFEIQQSPQTLATYIERQNKYIETQIETYWLLYQPRYVTITKAIKKLVLKELNYKLPPGGTFLSLNNLPVFYIDEKDYRVKGVGLFNYSIKDFLSSLINNKIIFNKTWRIQ